LKPQNNEGVRALFDAWLKLLKALGARRNTM